MKKCILFILLFAFSLSCSDQMNSIDPKVKEEKISINEAKEHFSIHSSIQGTEQAASEKSKRQSLAKHANWDHAFYQNLSTGSALIVPVKFDEEMYYKPNQDINIPASALTYLLFYKDGKKETHMEVITSVPSFDKTDTIPNQIFKGTILVENWTGEFIKGFILKNGKRYKMDKPSKRSLKGASTITVCTTTNWFTCVSVGGATPYCSFDYSETSCGEVYIEVEGVLAEEQVAKVAAVVPSSLMTMSMLRVIHTSLFLQVAREGRL